MLNLMFEIIKNVIAMNGKFEIASEIDLDLFQLAATG